MVDMIYFLFGDLEEFDDEYKFNGVEIVYNVVKEEKVLELKYEVSVNVF